MLSAVACSDSEGDDADSGSEPTAQASTAPTQVTAPPSLLAGEPTPSTTIEVQGVVGVVIETTRIIEIRPTGEEQGYTKIALTPNTTIVRAGGGAMPLDDVRPSDRIVAFGRPGDDPGTLISDDVTIQQVIQGGAPGGG